MIEIRINLPEEVYLKEPGGIKTRLEIGRLSIAGFTDLEFYLPKPFRTEGQNSWRFPYPLLLIDGDESCPRFTSGKDDESARFYGLEPDEETREWHVWSTWDAEISFPADGGQPSSYTGNAGWPSSARVFLFEPPIAYEQSLFEAKVTESLPASMEE